MTEKNELRIQNEISRLLLKESKNLAGFTKKLDSLADRFGDDLYPSLLFLTAHLEFSPRTARKHWREILRNWEWLSRNLQPDVDLRMAILHYFIDINRRIKNPKIIELKIFHKTQRETFIDELTQLHNYRYFARTLRQEVTRAKRYNSPLSLAIFDVDDFKYYNDNNGHLTGSKALKKFGRLLKNALRDVDIACRYGGEEFTLLLPETNKEGAFTIAERIRKKVEGSPFTAGEKQPLKKFTVSCGVATLNVDAKTGQALLKKADQALYRAKSLGKNRVVLYIDERRDDQRIKFPLRNRGIVTTANGDEYAVIDVSTGGLLLSSSKSFILGETMRLNLKLPGRKTPVPCRVKIRRMEELRKRGSYEVGASITQIRAGDRGVIQRFLDRESKKVAPPAPAS